MRARRAGAGRPEPHLAVWNDGAVSAELLNVLAHDRQFAKALLCGRNS